MRRGVHSLEASCTHHLFYRSRAHPRLPLLASSSWLFLSLLVSCVRHCVAFTSSSVIVVLLHRMHCLGSGLIGANNRLLHPSHERRRTGLGPHGNCPLARGMEDNHPSSVMTEVWLQLQKMQLHPPAVQSTLCWWERQTGDCRSRGGGGHP